MKDYKSYIKEFHDNNQIEIDFIENQLSKYLIEEKENQDEIEQILDYLYSKKPEIEKIWYKTLLEKTKKRHKKLQEVSNKDTEKEWVDYKVVKDFNDWFRFVKLISKKCYELEGKRMSHCVASYYGRDSKIYSLRDKKNNPHCTIEEWHQIKGKGNWKINPMYIDYVIKFLEQLGMTVQENEMKNLGYYNLDTIEKWLKCDKLYDKKYVFDWDIWQVKDKDWDIYYWFWLLNIKDIFEFDINLKFKLNFDIKAMVGYSINKIVKKDSSQLVSNWDYSKLASSWDYSQLASSWDYSKLASSWDHSQLASSWDYSKLSSSWNSSQLVSNWYSSKLSSSWDYSKLVSSWNSSQLVSNWYSSKLSSSWDYSKLVSNWYSSKLVSNWDYSKLVSSWDSSQLSSSWDHSQLAIEWKSSVWANIWIRWQMKGIIWTWITLAEYNNDWICVYVKSAKIDWKRIKENTWYELKNKQFSIVK